MSWILKEMMVKSIEIAIKNILYGAKRYDKENLNKVIDNLPKMESDICEGTLHVLKSFMYRFRDDELSKRYANCLEEAVRELYERRKLPLGGSINEQQVNYLLNIYEEKVRSYYNYNPNVSDKEMIKSYFSVAYRHLEQYNYNPVRYIREKIEQKKIWEAYYFFKINVKYCDQKVLGVLLRDLIDALDCRDKLCEGDLVYVFPVDTWVEQVTFTLWKDRFTHIPNNNKKREKKHGRLGLRVNEVKYIAIIECLKWGIHPSDYNKGAWKLASSLADRLDLETILFKSRFIDNPNSKQIQSS